MLTFDARRARNYPHAFAKQLALHSKASAAIVGLFHLAHGKFHDSWTGCCRETDEICNSTLADAVATILTATTDRHELRRGVVDATAGAASPTEARTTRNGWVIAVGDRSGDLVAVAAVFIRTPDPGANAGISALVQMAAGCAGQTLLEQVDDAASMRHGIAEHILAHLSFDFVVTTREGEVVYANPASTALPSRAPGVEILKKKLTARTPALHKRLSEAIRGAASPAGHRSVLQIEPGSKLPQVAVVLPIRTTPVLALVVFSPRQKDHTLSDQLLASYGLTNAERRLAIHLLRGKTVTEAAHCANLTPATARSYLKRIFSKTGSHRQSDLIFLCMSLLPPVRDRDAGGPRAPGPAEELQARPPCRLAQPAPAPRA